MQEYMKVMRLTNPSVRAIVEEIERDEIVRWSNSLTRAKVSRWGGMISTPDEYLQVRYSLIDFEVSMYIKGIKLMRSSVCKA